jgi:23S rRNA (guanosine2251-2'-O)-methyltransferase
VVEALRSGGVLRVLVAGSGEGGGIQAILEEAGQAGVPVRRVDRAEIDALSLASHQGVAAFIRPVKQLDERGLGATSFPKDAIVVVLDGVTDPQNLGACARAAEAAGASMLITRERRAAPLSPAAMKSSAGALLHLPVARVTNVSRAIDRLKDKGFLVVGLDQGAEETIHGGSPPDRPVALVVGSEGRGMSRLVRERCDWLVAIPLVGKTASLNAAAALAVGLFGYALRPPSAGSPTGSD